MIDYNALAAWVFIIQWAIGWPVAFWWLEWRADMNVRARDGAGDFALLVLVSWFLGVVFLPCCAWYWLWRLTIGRRAHRGD